MLRYAFFALILAAVIPNVSQASGSHRARHAVRDANGNIAHSLVTIRSRKTGASARVDSRYASEFQSYIDDLEDRGAVIRFMGGFRRGHCSSASLHPCGRALDICQRARGRVDAHCKLPGRSTLASIASSHGLFEGGRWCNSDYGHAQVGVTAEACSTSHVASARRGLLATRHGTPTVALERTELQ
jgi:hypothetical protein